MEFRINSEWVAYGKRFTVFDIKFRYSKLAKIPYSTIFFRTNVIGEKVALEDKEIVRMIEKNEIMEVKEYLGDCRNLANEYFSDATEMAQWVEKGIPINKEVFLLACSIDNNPSLKAIIATCTDFYKTEEGIYFAYDANKDIHYFWR